TQSPVDGDDWKDGYVYVDWGEPFRQAHEQFGLDVAPHLHFGVGQTALDYLLSNGGSGFFPARMVKALNSAGKLHRVPGVAEINRPGYVVYSEASKDSEVFRLALEVAKETLEA